MFAKGGYKMVTEFLSLLSVLLQCTNQPVQTNVSYQDEGVLVSDSSSFTRIGGSSLHKVLDCEDGYIYDQIDIYKHPYTESSDLYLFKVSAQFTPGIVALQNNTKRPDGSSYGGSYLKKGFIHIGCTKYQTTEYGGDISYKAISPISSTTTVTFTSSYGTSRTSSFSGSLGISADEMGTLKATAGVSASTSVTLSSQTSTSTTSEDPLLSVQYAYNTLNKTNEAQWSFSVRNPENAGAKTYWITSYLLFEMSNWVSYWNRDVFNSYIHFSFTTQRYRYTHDLYDTYKIWSERATQTSADGGTHFA